MEPIKTTGHHPFFTCVSSFSFSPEAAIGIGYEMQPVYRHLLWSYRNTHKDTMVGEPISVGGNPGFNSGVLLLDLAKLRNSELYERLNEVGVLLLLVFKGGRASNDALVYELILNYRPSGIDDTIVRQKILVRQRASR